MKKLVCATMALSILLMAGCHDDKKHRKDRHEDVPTADSCGSVTDVGMCTGTVVKYCDDENKLQEVDCKTKGMICGSKVDEDGDEYFDCVERSNCGNITDVGKCDGTMLSYCKDNRLEKIDCKTKNQVCGETTDAQGTYFDCLDKASTPGVKDDYTCEDLGELGKCVNGVAKYCANGTIESWDCANDAGKDSVCVIDKDKYAICSMGCGNVTSEGSCDGTLLSYCGDVTKEDGTKGKSLYKYDCKDAKQQCGKETKNGQTYYTCVTPEMN